MNELDIIKIKASAQRNLYRNTLIQRIESMIKQLQIQLDKLKEDEDYSPSSNGIIQGGAVEIDILATKISTMDDMIK